MELCIILTLKREIRIAINNINAINNIIKIDISIFNVGKIWKYFIYKRLLEKIQ